MTRPATSSARDERILVVDDEAGMREMLSMLLRRAGYDVSVAGDGKQALEILGAGDIDLVLCDVRMPEMDGLALLGRVAELETPVTVIMMSAFADLDATIDALKLGAADYVSKPFKPDEILLKIRIAQERQRLQDERERLRAENVRLRNQVDAKSLEPAGIIGNSRRMQEIFATVRKIADYKSTILLVGESGTGKELIARFVHDESVRREEAFVPINCGAIPEALLESELFGYVKGAFTDASRDKRGLVEEANGGTLFLDEIGELPLSLQVKLLRFLQEEEIRRVGDTKGISVDVRIVAATARDLGEMVTEGTFREDLYYRLNVLQLDLPPLRERKDDIPLLVDHFVGKYGHRLGRTGMSVARDALRVMVAYQWPGNIRELENTIERAMVLSDSEHIGPAELPERLTGERETIELPFVGDDLSIKKASRAIERELIRRGLERTAGNRTRAAELLEISQRALLYKIKQYGLG